MPGPPYDSSGDPASDSPPDSASGSAAPRPGDVIAQKYRVEKIIGAGGMGVVVLVKHLTLGQHMAIKLMTPGVAHDQQAVARFLREARAAAALHSEHVVRIFDVGTLESGAPYMVMELLRGEDLSQVLGKGGKLAIRDAVDYVIQACHAIAEAHATGIVHRDLKPSNLFLTRRSDGAPLVKVLDFGISKALRPDPEGRAAADLTSTSAVMGSPLYMSPEQVRNAKNVDARADIWSLGVILHELLTGLPAFTADTLPAICAAIIADDPPPLSALRDDAPANLEDIVSGCLEKDVNDRFQTVDELMLVLRAFVEARFPEGTSSSPAVPTKRTPGVQDVAATRVSPVWRAEAAAARDHAQADGAKTSVDPVRVASQPDGGPSSLETSALPIASSQRDPRQPGGTGLRTALVFVAAFVLVGGVAIWLRRAQAPALPLRVEATQSPVPRKTFTLIVDSTPGGALVAEGDDVLGTTPMQMSIDNDFAQRKPRKITLRRDGFQPYSILQGPSDDNVHIIATLVEARGEPPPPAGPGGSVALPVAPAPGGSGAGSPVPSPVAPPPGGSSALPAAHASKPARATPSAVAPSSVPSVAPAIPPPTPPPSDIRLTR